MFLWSSLNKMNNHGFLNKTYTIRIATRSKGQMEKLEYVVIWVISIFLFWVKTWVNNAYFMYTSLGCRVPLDAQVLSQALGQRSCHGQAVAVLWTQQRPGIIHLQSHTLWYVWAEWWSMVGNKSDLIDSDSTAHRAHASKVRSTAPAVVEGHISTGNDVRQRQTWTTDKW